METLVSYQRSSEGEQRIGSLVNHRISDGELQLWLPTLAYSNHLKKPLALVL